MLQIKLDEINRDNLENFLNFKIEGYRYFPYSDLSDYEIETILENIADGYSEGEFKTLSGNTDNEVLLTWKLKV